MGFWGEAHASVSHIGETGQTLHGHTYAAVKMAREDKRRKSKMCKKTVESSEYSCSLELDLIAS